MNDELDVLKLFSRDCRPSECQPLGSAGGMSGAQFWRIAAPVVPVSPGPARGALCLRRWPPEHPTPQRLKFIHAVLFHARRNGIAFLPVPITTGSGHSFVDHDGYLWELAPWMPGIADYEHSPSAERLHAAMTSLAQFHIATRDFKIAGDLRVAGHAPAIHRRLDRLKLLMRGGIAELAGAITPRVWPQLAVLAREFMAAVPSALPRSLADLEPLADVPLPIQVCLRDIWHDHVLFTGNEVTGIVDFGAVDVDTPATDIARLLGSFASAPLCGQEDADSPTWQAGLAAYRLVRPLSEEETLAVQALDTSGTILAGCNWIRWIYIDGRRFENRDQVVARFRRILARAAGIH